MVNERGRGRFGVVVWLVILSIAIFVAVRTIPTRVAVLQLHDFADETVQFAATNSKIDEGKLIKTILDKARELDVPLDAKQLRLEVHPGDVRLSMTHRVTINLEVYEWVWDFNEKFTHMRI